MSHENGRCASDSETVYAGGLGCFDVGGGTQQAPACRLDELVPRVTASTTLIVVRGTTNGADFNKSFPLTVVGKGGASITAPMTGELQQVFVRSGTVTFRDLLFEARKPDPSSPYGSVYGISNYTGSLLQLDRCRFTGMGRMAIAVFGGYRITNTIVDNSGTFMLSVPVLLGTTDSSVPRLFAYNTITNNRWFIGCGSTASAPEERANLITDGVAAAAEPYFGCTSTFPNSRIGPHASFDQRPGREYRLTAASGCVNWAQDPSPPSTDIDGDLRGPGLNDCGADKFVP